MAKTSDSRGWDSLLRCAIALAGLLSLVTGCGSFADSPTGRVHGRVTFDGAPVREGVVSIYSAELGVGASADLGEDGGYTVSEPLRTGKYTVTVLPPSEPPPEPDKPTASSKTYPNIPPKYRDPQKSGLSVDITEGDNAVDVNMTK